MEIFFDDVAQTDDEVEIADLDNLLLATLVAFALSIRECRRDPAAIRKKLLDYICSITPATWAAILPPPESDIHFDPIGQTNGIDVPQALRVKSSIVRHVSETGVPIMSSAVLCVTMRAFHSVQGIIYAEASPDEPFNRLHLELLMGVAAAGAIGIEHAATVQILDDNKHFNVTQTRSQDPIYSSQGHAIYSFRQGVWASLDTSYFAGGQSTLDGIPRHNIRRQNWRAGGTLALPVNMHNSVKIYASRGVAARTGTSFDLIGLHAIPLGRRSMILNDFRVQPYVIPTHSTSAQFAEEPGAGQTPITAYRTD